MNFAVRNSTVTFLISSCLVLTWTLDWGARVNSSIRGELPQVP
jgi:hypothetical protein